MSFKIFLRLSENWALGYDPLQWIVLRRYPLKAGGEKWKAVSFVASEKRILLRVLREKCAVITPPAQRDIDALPDTFGTWIKGFPGPSTDKRSPNIPEQASWLSGSEKNAPPFLLKQMAGE